MIERLRPGINARHARVVLFDFDGTLSLIRTGWMDVMIPMMVEILLELKTGETEEQLREVVTEFVTRLTGKQTIYQMIALAEEVRKRGGQPLDPLQYKKRYLQLLWEKIKDRVRELERGEAPPEKYLVPGAREFLEALKERGFKMYLASGTDQDDARREADLLDISKYFDGGVYGALDDYKRFSKALLIQQIISTMGCRGEEILGFGDGYVEIENVKQVGGVAVGVATDEPECQRVNEWKRQRLTGVGADFIIPNYLEREEILAELFPNSD